MYVVEEEQCNACGICVSQCPVGAISINNDVAAIDQDRCSDCGTCFDACLHNAICELSEPRRIASVAQPMYGRESACSPLEQTSSLLAPTARVKSGTTLVAIFPVLLKLAGSLADYLSMRANRASGLGGNDPKGSRGRGIGHQGRQHRRRGF